MDGGYYLVQHVELDHPGQKITGVEYIGFDEDTGTLRSHFMSSFGANFTYTWDLVDRDLYTWFGDKDAASFFHGRLSDDGTRYEGAWQWPDDRGGTGGYSANAVRITHPA